MESVKSLNDLSIKIHEIGKKYDIKSFVSEFKTSVREVNQKAWDEIDSVTASDVFESTPLSELHFSTVFESITFSFCFVFSGDFSSLSFCTLS